MYTGAYFHSVCCFLRQTRDRFPLRDPLALVVRTTIGAANCAGPPCQSGRLSLRLTLTTRAHGLLVFGFIGQSGREKVMRDGLDASTASCSSAAVGTSGRFGIARQHVMMRPEIAPTKPGTMQMASNHTELAFQPRSKYLFNLH